MDINKILNQMEATIELWENLKGDYKDSYLEFRYEETKTVCNFIKDCKYEIEKLQNQLQQKENIIKEVREFVEKWKYADGDGSVYFDMNTNPDDLLEILDKGE